VQLDTNKIFDALTQQIAEQALAIAMLKVQITQLEAELTEIKELDSRLV
jgi:Tfp pilus assembly protein PilN